MAANCNKFEFECVNEYVKDNNCITNVQHLVEGLKVSKNNKVVMYLYAPLLIKVVGGTIVIEDRYSREFLVKLQDTLFNTLFAFKNFLATCNCLCDDNQVTGGDLKIVEEPGHGFIMPTEGFIPITKKSVAAWMVADTTTRDNLHEMFIVDIIDADSFVVQQNGYLTVPNGHGLTEGEYYYLNDAGGVDSFPDAEFDDVVAYVMDDYCLMLIDNRPLDLTVNNEGFLLPNLTTVERDAIVTPITGKMIYNTTTDQVEVVNNAGAWKAVP